VIFGQLRAVTTKTGYNYWLQIPEISNKKEKLPVIIFLHGRSLSGNDLNRVKRYGVLRAIERGKDLQAIVIAPQTSNGWDPDKVIDVLDQVLAEQPAAKTRQYDCATSMGPSGTLDATGNSPNWYAA